MSLNEERILTVRVKGWPWWRDRYTDDEEGHVDFYFSGVNLNSIDFRCLGAESDDEFLEGFKVRKFSDNPFASGQDVHIFCNGVMPDVPAFLLGLERSLAKLEYPFTISDILSGDGYATNLFKFHDQGSFLLARAPSVIASGIRRLLIEQGIDFSEFSYSHDRGAEYWVSIGGVHFFCDETTATF